jgi:hypothetical protein
MNSRRSFDHLVGACEERRRDFDAERLGGLKIDHQIELDRQLDRQIGGLSPLENLTRIDAGLTINIRNIGSVTHQPTGLGFDAGDPHGGQPLTGGEQRNLAALAGKFGCAGW